MKKYYVPLAHIVYLMSNDIIQNSDIGAEDIEVFENDRASDMPAYWGEKLNK